MMAENLVKIIRILSGTVKAWFRSGLWCWLLLGVSLGAQGGASDLPVYKGLGNVNFSLASTLGESHGLDRFQDKIILLMFGFTHCPSICPMTLQKMAKVKAELDQPTDLQLVLISVDAERDTVERLTEYLSGFNAGIVGFTGSSDQLNQVARDFAATFFPEEDDIRHTDRVYLIDQLGQVRHLFEQSATVADMLSGIQSLQESSSSGWWPFGNK